MMTTPSLIPETTRGQAICPYCGVGCRLLMEAAHGALTRVTGVADGPADRIARARTADVLLPGVEPEHRRHVEEQQPHQPPPLDRADRQAGYGAVQPDRPAERDGGPRSRAP